MKIQNQNKQAFKAHSFNTSDIKWIKDADTIEHVNCIMDELAGRLDMLTDGAESRTSFEVEKGNLVAIRTTTFLKKASTILKVGVDLLKKAALRNIEFRYMDHVTYTPATSVDDIYESVQRSMEGAVERFGVSQTEIDKIIGKEEIVGRD